MEDLIKRIEELEKQVAELKANPFWQYIPYPVYPPVPNYPWLPHTAPWNPGLVWCGTGNLTGDTSTTK